MGLLNEIAPWPAGGPTVHVASPESLGDTLRGAAFASAAWSAISRIFLMPFELTRPYLVAQLFLFNGAAVSGNVDVGIYTDQLQRIASSGSTVQAGVNVLQLFNVTEFTLNPGQYYLAAVANNTTGTSTRANVGAARQKIAGVLQLNSTFPLPASASAAVQSTIAYLPMVGFTKLTTL